jgi:hypothetical protein
MTEAALRGEGPGQPVSADHLQITFTALRAISLSSARGMPARARIAMVCSVADASTASAAGSASAFSSPLSRAIGNALRDRRRAHGVLPRERFEFQDLRPPRLLRFRSQSSRAAGRRPRNKSTAAPRRRASAPPPRIERHRSRRATCQNSSSSRTCPLLAAALPAGHTRGPASTPWLCAIFLYHVGQNH